MTFVTIFFLTGIFVSLTTVLWIGWLRPAFRRYARTCYFCAYKYQLTTEMSDIYAPCDICNRPAMVCTWTRDLNRYTPIDMQLKQLRRKRIGEKRQNEIRR